MKADKRQSSLDHSFAPKSGKKLSEGEREFAFESKRENLAGDKSEKKLLHPEDRSLVSNQRSQKESKKPVKSDFSNEPGVSVDKFDKNKSEVLSNIVSSDAASAATAASAVTTDSRPSKKPRETENWLLRRGHAVTYALLFAFTFVLYFRPYEMFPALAGFSSIAFYLAIGTILIFVPSQIATESSFTARPPEVNYVLLLALFGIITVPIARDPTLAWNTFNDPFLKVLLMFIVMVNVVRTEKRLKGLIWLALAVGIWISIDGIQNYNEGKLAIEDYRAMANIKGMFGNPNAQAMHLVAMLPIAIACGLATKNYLLRIFYFAVAALFVGGNMVTYSRGGFLGLLLTTLVLAWKFGRNNRFQVIAACAVAVTVFLAVAPGGYGQRVASIFNSSLDPVGSSNQRQELFWTSLIVTLRNPWGIGMNNFKLANPYNLLTHNSYTQVSSEMGIAALWAYIMFIFEPFRRLFRMEQELRERGDNHNWIYYLTIGLQAGLAGYCVASFFDAAAYEWFLYYLVAYAVCLRRVYKLAQSKDVLKIS